MFTIRRTALTGRLKDLVVQQISSTSIVDAQKRYDQLTKIYRESVTEGRYKIEKDF